MNEVQQILEEVSSQQVTVGELLTLSLMYPPHHEDPYLQNVREALRLIEEQSQRQS